jgi:hypothetical protein
MSPRMLLGPLVLFAVLGSPLSAPAQQVYKNVSSEAVERVLRDLGIDHKKTQGKKDTIHNYDYKRNGYNIRLVNYEGKDLWIQAEFTYQLSLDDVNRWNVRAKFSRLVLLQNSTTKQNYVSLETQYDCSAGCTDGIIRQFVNRFDGEIRDFVDFFNKK